MTVAEWLLSEAESHDREAARWRASIVEESARGESMSPAGFSALVTSLVREEQSARTLRILAKAKQAQHEIPEGA